MDVLILTPIRMLGEGLEHCLSACGDLVVTDVVSDFAQLRAALDCFPAGSPPVLVLIDVTQGVDLEEVRRLATDYYPTVTLLALGLKSQQQEVVRAGRAGFSAFVSREAAIATLIEAMRGAAAGKLTCSEEIAGGLLRALFRNSTGVDADTVAPPAALDDTCLTRRQSDVARLISRGLSNKEIARELDLSVATVKHHVHSLLTKLSLQRRSHVMRKVREAPWITAFPEPDRRRLPR
jgi:two-component system, NarL family, nitrate/nitrite response regulator NarL